MLRFPWRDVQRALGELAAVTPRDEAVQLAYVNPETGRECLAALGFSALQLRPGEELRLPRRSASAVVHVVDGARARRSSTRQRIASKRPTRSPCRRTPTCRLANGSGAASAYLFVVDDAPLQRKLGIYEVHASTAR